MQQLNEVNFVHFRLGRSIIDIEVILILTYIRFLETDVALVREVIVGFGMLCADSIDNQVVVLIYTS